VARTVRRVRNIEGRNLKIIKQQNGGITKKFRIG
jgi:hypothetical protein